MIRQMTKNTLDAPTRPHVEIKPSEVVLMEGSDAARWEEQLKNVAHCPLPILDTKICSERYYHGPSVHCRVRGIRHRATKMVLCDDCNQGYHLWCLDKPLLRVPEDPWKCPWHEGMDLSPSNHRD